jgi:hypothetical protein
MFNPKTFTFDKSGLRKESKNFQPEKIDEEDGKIGAVEVDNIPRSQRRKSPSRQSRKQSQKRFRKNESYHRKSKKVFSDKYNIEEKTKLDNDKYISEDSEDSKFNTEKYHKKQHKT